MPSAIRPLDNCPPDNCPPLFGGHLAGEHLAEGIWTKDGEHLPGGHLSRGLFLESYCKRAFGRGLFAWRASGTKSNFARGNDPLDLNPTISDQSEAAR